MPFTSQQLATEINTDPKALGYAALVAAHDRMGLAAKLNATYAGVGIVYRNDLKSWEVLAALVESEVTSLSVTAWTRVQTLLIPSMVDATQQRIRDQFAGIFVGKAATLANLDAVARKVAPSRAEELWGYKTTVSDQDIANAGIG